MDSLVVVVKIAAKSRDICHLPVDILTMVSVYVEFQQEREWATTNPMFCKAHLT